MAGYFEAMATEAPTTTVPEVAPLALRVRRLDALHDAERAFAHLYGDSQNAFWLDSSRDGERGRFSFIGDGSGPLGAVVSYDVATGEVRVERGGEVEISASRSSTTSGARRAGFESRPATCPSTSTAVSPVTSGTS